MLEYLDSFLPIIIYILLVILLVLLIIIAVKTIKVIDIVSNFIQRVFKPRKKENIEEEDE